MVTYVFFRVTAGEVAIFAMCFFAKTVSGVYKNGYGRNNQND